MTIADRLRRWESFSHFPAAQLELLATCVGEVALPAGATVLRQGEASTECYLIESGAVEIKRDTPYGLFTLAGLGPGDLFGETTFIDRLERSGDAIASAPTTLLAFDPGGAGALLERDPRLALALYWSFWKSLSNKLRLTNDVLTRFFSESGKPPVAMPALAAEAGPEFRIDLGAKRKLFEEQKLSGLEINFLASLSQEQKLRSGDVIFREGDHGDRMYVVLEGRVMISKYIPGAGEEALAFLERGDYFGEMALIDKQPRSAQAKAHAGGAVVLAIPAEVLEGILDINRVSSLRLLKLLCALVARRLRELDDKLAGWFILAGGTPGTRPAAG